MGRIATLSIAANMVQLEPFRDILIVVVLPHDSMDHFVLASGPLSDLSVPVGGRWSCPFPTVVRYSDAALDFC